MLTFVGTGGQTAKSALPRAPEHILYFKLNLRIFALLDAMMVMGFRPHSGFALLEQAICVFVCRSCRNNLESTKIESIVEKTQFLSLFEVFDAVAFFLSRKWWVPIFTSKVSAFMSFLIGNNCRALTFCAGKKWAGHPTDSTLIRHGAVVLVFLSFGTSFSPFSFLGNVCDRMCAHCSSGTKIPAD